MSSLAHTETQGADPAIRALETATAAVTAIQNGRALQTKRETRHST